MLIRSNKGLSVVEIMISIAVVSIFTVSLLPFFGIQRKLVNSSHLLPKCLAELHYAQIKLESGGIYSIATPTKNSIISNTQVYSSRPPIYTLPPASERASFIDGKNLSFEQRFNSIKGNTDLYVTRGESAANEYLSVFDKPNRTTVPAGNPLVSFKVENDGIVSYIPLLMRGTVADIADLYNDPSARSGALPSYLRQQDINSIANAQSNPRIRIYRIRLDNKRIQDTNLKFWPIARPGFGGLADDTEEKYKIRDPQHRWNLYMGNQNGVDLGNGFLIAKFPTNPASEGLSMSWNYGFRVFLQNTYSEDNGNTSVDCQLSKEYFLPSDFQNIQSAVQDFNFIQLPNGDPDDIPYLPVSYWLSDKFYTIGIGQENNDITNRAVNNYCASNCNSQTVAPTLKPEVRNYINIFTNTNFGIDPSNNKPMAQHGKQRPICSQNENSKTFQVVIRFKNLNKEPGAIPMCLDDSWKPPGLGKDNHSNVPNSRMWCEAGDVTNGNKADGSSLLIMDHIMGEGGYVPCERLRFCGQNPDAVNVHFPVNSVTGVNDGSIEYRYNFHLNGNDNSIEKNKLWGCDMAFKAAILDAAGNLNYVAKIMNDPASANSMRDFFGSRKSSGKEDYAGASAMPIESTSLNIYAKPPPCYDCTCKKCKGNKDLFGALLGIIFFVVFIYIGGPALFSSLSTINFAATVSFANIVTGVAGFLFLGAAACGLQLSGLTDGGMCSPWEYSAYTGQFRSCRSKPANTVCGCGENCKRIDPPSPRFIKSLPKGEKDSSVLGFCPFSWADVTIDGFTFKEARGVRFPSGVDAKKFDTNALIDYNASEGPKFVDSDGADNPNGLYAAIGDVSSFTYVDFSTGMAYYTESICDYDDTLLRAVWRRNTSKIDDLPEGIVKYGAKLKTGYRIMLHDPAHANFESEVTNGKIASPQQNPVCLAPDPDNDLINCSDLKLRCYQVAGNRSYADLISPAGGGAFTGRLGSSPPTPITIQVPNADNTRIINKNLTFAVKKPPQCLTEFPGENWNVLQSQANPSIDFTYPPNGSKGTPEGSTLSGIHFNSECVGGIYGALETGPCVYTCTPNQATMGCDSSNNTLGTCDPVIEQVCNATIKPDGSCSAPKVPTVVDCTKVPQTCKRKQYTRFVAWHGCDVPENFVAHLTAMAEPIPDMVCYEDDYTISNPAYSTNLPFCPDPDPDTGGTLGGARAGADMYYESSCVINVINPAFGSPPSGACGH